MDTYTSAWGVRTAPAIWLAVLLLTGGVAALALRAIGGSIVEMAGLAVLMVLAATPALLFLGKPAAGMARRIEAASGAWTIAMYLALGVGRAAARGLGIG